MKPPPSVPCSSQKEPLGHPANSQLPASASASGPASSISPPSKLPPSKSASPSDGGSQASAGKPASGPRGQPASTSEPASKKLPASWPPPPVPLPMSPSYAGPPSQEPERVFRAHPLLVLTGRCRRRVHRAGVDSGTIASVSTQLASATTPSVGCVPDLGPPSSGPGLGGVDVSPSTARGQAWRPSRAGQQREGAVCEGRKSIQYARERALAPIGGHLASFWPSSPPKAYHGAASCQTVPEPRAFDA